MLDNITNQDGCILSPAALNAAVRGDLANAVVASTPGGIERQEAEGQRCLIESTYLPKEIDGATREQLETLGFKFGADVDELFVSCELPSGWKKEATDHSMHSNLVDEQGRRRASIFYKAAFYDRRADMRVLPRFGVCAYEDCDQADHYTCAVVDADRSVVFKAGDWGKKDYRGQERLIDSCKDWLKTNFPDWKNPLAYW